MSHKADFDAKFVEDTREFIGDVTAACDHRPLGQFG